MSPNSSLPSGGRTKRAGVILIVVLACLAISVGMIANSLRSATQARRELQVNLQRQQTEWLLLAGIGRARTELQLTSAYPGETWDASEDLPEFQAAVVTIDILQPDELSRDALLRDGLQRDVRVTARLEAAGANAQATQLSHRFTYAARKAVDVPNELSSPENTGADQ